MDAPTGDLHAESKPGQSRRRLWTALAIVAGCALTTPIWFSALLVVLYQLAAFMFESANPTNSVRCEGDTLIIMHDSHSECCMFLVDDAGQQHHLKALKKLPTVQDHQLVLLDRSLPILWEAPQQPWPEPDSLVGAYFISGYQPDSATPLIKVEPLGGAELGMRSMIKLTQLDAAMWQAIDSHHAAVVISYTDGRLKGMTYYLPVNR